jgi:DNA-binding NarL/FixJ family response regulator
MLVKACREALRTAGQPVPRRGRGYSEVPERLRALGVTSRETDVLRLVVAGMGNSAIADRLCLSPRTVETHIASLFVKTGVSNRAELTKYMPNRD